VGTNDEVILTGVPLGKMIEKNSYISNEMSVLEEYHPDLTFIQYNPCHYLAR